LITASAENTLTSTSASIVHMHAVALPHGRGQRVAQLPSHLWGVRPGESPPLSLSSVHVQYNAGLRQRACRERDGLDAQKRGAESLRQRLPPRLRESAPLPSNGSTAALHKSRLNRHLAWPPGLEHTRLTTAPAAPAAPMPETPAQRNAEDASSSQRVTSSVRYERR